MITLLLFYFYFIASVFLSYRQTPLFLFVLYQMIYFVNPKTKWWASSVPDISYSFYIVLTLLIIFFLKQKDFKANKLEVKSPLILLGGFIFTYSLVYFWAMNPDAHFKNIDALLTAFVLIIVVSKMASTIFHLHCILVGYLVSSTYLGYYISQVGRNSGGRFSGAGMVDAPDANGIAVALLPAIFVAGYYFLFSKRKIYKFMSVVAAAYLANALTQIGSRGSWLALGVGGIFFLYFLFSKSGLLKIRKSYITLLCVVAFSIAPLVVDDALVERLKSIAIADENVAAEKETGSTRVYYWVAALDMAQDYPFGKGAKSFIYLSHLYIPEEVQTGSSRNRSVHSTWFEVLSESGYLGLFLYVSSILLLVVNLRRAKKLSERLLDNTYLKVLVTLEAGFISLLVSMSFINRLKAEIFYWMFLFIVIAINLTYKTFNDEQSDEANI